MPIDPRIYLLVLAIAVVGCIEPLPTASEVPELRCGDGLKSANEECDDGNLSDRDGCTNLCEVAVCNDGIKRLDLSEDAPDYEVCDDGNSNENDGCTSLCKPPSCHDGIKQNWEACDDGNTDNTDACVGECVLSACGDGFVHEGVEACEPEADDAPENCGQNCQLETCGNGIVEGEEECDDGNQVDSDSCLDNCLSASCGDGIQRMDLQEGDEGFEACDGEDLPEGARWCSDCRIDDHSNGPETARRKNPGDEWTANLSSGDEDWIQVMAPVDGNYVFSALAQGDDRRADGLPALRCELRDEEQRVGSTHRHDSFETAGCRVTQFFHAGETLYLRLYHEDEESEQTYDVSLFPICGNGFHDPDEQCDPTVGDRTGTNRFRCRSDCRLRQQEALSPYNICLVDDGELLCWGSNDMLLLGDPPVQQCLNYAGEQVTASRFPVRILSREANVSTIAVTINRACLVARDGDTLACWGFELNTTPLRLRGGLICSPRYNRPFCADAPVDLLMSGTSGVALGENHQCGIWGGRIACWGTAEDGNLGAGAGMGRVVTIDELTYFQTPEEADFVYVQSGRFFNCAIDEAKQLWCWGRNTYGQLGVFRRVQDHCLTHCENTPQPVDGIGAVVNVILGDTHVCALNEDGEVWCWGRNQSGQTGAESDPEPCGVDDENQPRPCVRVPTRVAGIPRAVELSAGRYHTCIISDEGEVWCWGRNVEGQIGTGYQSEQLSEPSLVAGLPPVETIFLGGMTSCARHGSRVWCWGSNNMGQFGVECGGSFSSPRRLTMLD